MNNRPTLYPVSLLVLFTVLQCKPAGLDLTPEGLQDPVIHWDKDGGKSEKDSFQCLEIITSSRGGEKLAERLAKPFFRTADPNRGQEGCTEFKSRADTACRIEIRLDFTRVEKELRALEEKINEDTIPDQLELYIILYEGGAEYPAVTRLSCLDQKDRAAERVLRTLSIKGARIARLENLFQSAEK